MNKITKIGIIVVLVGLIGFIINPMFLPYGLFDQVFILALFVGIIITIIGKLKK